MYVYVTLICIFIFGREISCSGYIPNSDKFWCGHFGRTVIRTGQGHLENFLDCLQEKTIIMYMQMTG